MKGAVMMSNNYYWIDERHENEDHIFQHIGKTSAAGYYCYDCGTTLNSGGTQYVHRGKRGDKDDMFNIWLDACPGCGEEKKTTCSSFTWTLLKHKNEITNLAKTHPLKKIIVDEYGKEMTADEFLEKLQYCPIQFQMPSEFS